MRTGVSLYSCRRKRNTYNRIRFIRMLFFVLGKKRPKRDCSGSVAALRLEQKTPKTPTEGSIL
jgi:hypothetical protein